MDASIQDKVNQLYGTIEWQNDMLKVLQKWETAASQAVKGKYSIFPPKLPQLSDYLAKTWFTSQTKPVTVKVQAPPTVSITNVPTTKTTTVKPEEIKKYTITTTKQQQPTVSEAGIFGNRDKSGLILAGIGALMLLLGNILDKHNKRK